MGEAWAWLCGWGWRVSVEGSGPVGETGLPGLLPGLLPGEKDEALSSISEGKGRGSCGGYTTIVAARGDGEAGVAGGEAVVGWLAGRDISQHNTQQSSLTLQRPVVGEAQGLESPKLLHRG